MLPKRPSFQWISLLISGALTTALIGACTATAPTAEQLAAVPVGEADKLLVVDCLLPGQIRKLGQAMVYLSARRPIKTTASDCEIRGGEYVAYDRANYATALKVWLPPAQEGDPAAQTYVGEIYEKGLGLAPDYALAAEWYRKAAEQGYSRAQINLGFLYEKGLGVSKDTSRALNWYRKASGLSGDNLAFTSSLQTVETERTQLRQELALRDQEIQALRGQLQQTQSQLQSRRERLEATQRELENTRRQLQQQRRFPSPPPASDATTQQLQQRLAERQEQLEKQKQEIAYLQHQTELQRAQLTAEMRASEKRAKGTQVDMAEYQRAKLSSERERASLQQQVDYLRKQLAGYQDQLKDSKKELENLNLSRQQLQQQLERQQRSQAPPPDNAEAERLKKQLSEKSSELDQTRQRIADLESEVKRRQEELDQLKSLPAKRTDLATRQVTPGGTVTEQAPKLPTAELNFGAYYALIIGNNRYQHLPNLETAHNDATAIARLLKDRYGFEIQVLTDANRYQILTALNEFRAKLTEKDNFLLYYAGHGQLDSDNVKGNWLPVDAEPNNNANWISSDAITDILNAMTAKHVIVIADSCYSGIMLRSFTTSTEGGRSEEKRLAWLKHMIEQRSRTVLTSGGVEPVLDSGGGGHSLFARALLNVLASSREVLESPFLYRQVTKQVKIAAARLNVEQDPRYGPLKFAGDLGAPFFFKPVN
jgi:predicted  nucleic acid-binding Zn-ribbon protein